MSKKNVPPVKLGYRPLHVSGYVAFSNNLGAGIGVDR